MCLLSVCVVRSVCVCVGVGRAKLFVHPVRRWCSSGCTGLIHSAAANNEHADMCLNTCFNMVAQAAVHRLM